MSVAKVGLNVSERGMGSLTVDGREWPKVRAVTIRAEVDCLTIIDVEMFAKTESAVEGDVRAHVTTFTCGECGAVKEPGVETRQTPTTLQRLLTWGRSLGRIPGEKVDIDI